MPENGQATPGGSDSDNQVTGVSDSGMATAGGGQYGWIFEGVGSALDGWYARESAKKSLRGYDPCHYWASTEEVIGTNVGPKWWKAHSAAQKTAQALERVINEDISNLGKPKIGRYLVSQKFIKYLRNQVSEGDLVPALAYVVALLHTGPGAGAAIDAFITERLPSGNDILNNRVTGARNGLQVGTGVYLWAPGLPENPSGAAEEFECLIKGKYSGPEILQVVDGWIEQERTNVVPAGFLSARRKLEKLTGTWEGTGPWGIWQLSDGIAPTSHIGYLDSFLEKLWIEFEEAQVLCEELREFERDFAVATLEEQAEIARKKALLDASKYWGFAAALLVGAVVWGKR